jgi:hypothetical protein
LTICPQDGDGTFGFKDCEMDTVRALVSVLSQHCLQIGICESALAQIALVDVTVADEHFQRRVDESSNPGNEAQSRQYRVGDQQRNQGRGCAEPRGVAGGGRATDDGSGRDRSDPVEWRELGKGASLGEAKQNRGRDKQRRGFEHGITGAGGVTDQYLKDPIHCLPPFETRHVAACVLVVGLSADDLAGWLITISTTPRYRYQL